MGGTGGVKTDDEGLCLELEVMGVWNDVRDLMWMLHVLE